MGEQRYTAKDLISGLDNAGRDAVMRAGTAPPFEDLLGWEFAGTNTLVLTSLIGIRKFKKGFYEGPARAEGGPEPFIQGYNVTVKQNGVGKPHIATPSEEAPHRADFFRVHAIDEDTRHNRYPNSLLLHYGYGGNGRAPSRMLRDYLVRVNPDDRDLLLGKAYLAPGSGRGFVLSYFVLERNNEHDFTG